jgi:hypothetical protein
MIDLQQRQQQKQAYLVSGFLVFNAKKPTRTEQNRFDLNRFSIWSGLY